MYIYKAGVVGAGAMGAEIAQVITYAGLPVVLKDINRDLVQKGVEKIKEIYRRRVEKGKMSESELAEKMKLVTPTESYEPLKEVDIVIEAVPEEMSLKKGVFRELDSFCPEATVLATNTSSLSISELGSVTRRPQKVIGMHFFYPAHVMKLVEVIAGLATSDETTEDVSAFAESLRKIPIRVNECAGFLVNRLLMPYLNEAAFCIQEGIADFQMIDQAALEFGFPMGPFTLIDNLGLDICAGVVKVLVEAYGSRMRPAELWEEFAKARLFGRKTGAGFYNYRGEENHRGREIVQRLREKYATKKGRFSFDRLILAMINEAAYCLQENVVKPGDMDLAVRAGLGFPEARRGILAYADEMGLDRVLKGLEALYQECGERFWPCPLLRRYVGAQFLGRKTKRGFLEYTG